MSKPRSRLRNVAEYAGIRAIELALRLLPFRWAVACGRRLGRLACVLDRRHRVVAEENAAWALGLGPAEARRFVRRVYSNVGATAIECLLLPHLVRRGRFSAISRCEGIENIHAALAKGKGAIVITAHVGNWEFSGLAVARAVGSLLSVARQLDNPLLDAYFLRTRAQLGQEIVDREGALRRVVRHLRGNGIVAMLIDQNQREGGVFVDFFGRLASTVPSPARIALKYDVPVMLGYGRRTEDGSHVSRISSALELIRTGDIEADVVANTALFTRGIEEVVRDCPDQWLWLHSRWRKRPPEEKKAKTAAPAPEAAPAGRTTP